MTVQKRKPTEYRILIRPRSSLGLKLMEVGTIIAFTPQQAQRKAAASIPAIAMTARRQKLSEIAIFAVPATSMKPGFVRFTEVARVQEPANA